MSAPTKFSEVAQRLVDNGYRPVPIAPGKKYPAGINAWQQFAFAPGCELSFKAHGAGVLLGEVIGIDIDVSDPDAVAAIENAVREIVGIAEAADLLRRVGQAPRALLPFRTKLPFDKVQTGSFHLRHGAPDEKPSKVEILAQGQQFVAYAIHPETKRPYEWNGHDLLNTPAAELPLLDAAQARRIIHAAEEILNEWGERIGAEEAQRKEKKEPPDGPIPKGARNDTLSKLAYKWRLQGLSVEQIVILLRDVNARRCSPPLDDDELRAIAAGKRKIDDGNVSLDDFLAYMPLHKYIFKPTGELWPPESINNRLPGVAVDGVEKPIKPAAWLDQNEPVEQMTWAPCEPALIEGKLIDAGGWITRSGCRVFNLYRPPAPLIGDPTKAQPWRDHLEHIYPEEHDHIEHWLAHRVQRPGEKLNHALVLQGAQGIGKDTILEPVKHAVGPWNWQEINAAQVLANFNPWARAVVVRVNEARDLGDFDRFAFYDHMKVYAASPPDVLRVNAKFLNEHYIPNLVSIIITSNYEDAIYLDSDDRRHFVAGSEANKEEFEPEYWNRLWTWYQTGGIGHVASYLRTLDLSAFDPKAPPPKTAAFWRIVHSNAAPEDAAISDVLDALQNPSVLTLAELAGAARDRHFDDLAEFLTGLKTRRLVQHRLKAAGYVLLPNDTAKDGLWRIGRRRQAVYRRQDLTYRAAVEAMRSRGTREGVSGGR